MAVVKPIPTGFQVVDGKWTAVDLDDAVTGFEAGFVGGESFADFHNGKDGLAVFGHGGETEGTGIEFVGTEAAVGTTEEMLAGFAIDAAKVNSLALDWSFGGGEPESEFFAEESG